MDANADAYIRLQEQMESSRTLFEGQWREVAERVRPNSNLFHVTATPGEKRDQLIFDDTAPLALSKFVAACISMAFPFNGQWHGITSADPKLAEMPEVKRYYEALTTILFKVRYAPRANFGSQLAETILDIGAFGTGTLFVEDEVGAGIRYKSIPLSESYIGEDYSGTIDTHHRKFEMTAHQAMTWAQKMGVANMPQAIRDAAEKQPLTKFWFLHTVSPNQERVAGLKGYKGMAYKSCYIAMQTRDTLSEGGFRTFPYACGRFETAPRETYGRGPGMKVLRSIKALNEMKKTIIRAGQMVVAPPIMLTDDASLNAFDVRSDALNFGYMGSNGQPLAMPFETKARVDIGIELMDKEREVINDAFFVTLFRILVEEPQITATEAMLRAQEKGQLLAPTMGRLQSEIGSTIVTRELDILLTADAAIKRMGGEGFLPPMPDVLMESGAEYKIEYTGPLNQAQRAGTGVAILNTIQSLAPLVSALGEEAGKKVAMMFNAERTVRELAEANGAPERIMNTPDELAAMDQAEQQAAQMQTLLQAAPVAAGAAKDLAQAGALAASSPSGAAPALFPA